MEMSPSTDAVRNYSNQDDHNRFAFIEVRIEHLRREIEDINKRLYNQYAENTPSLERSIYLERENSRLTYEVRSLKEKVLALVQYISGEDHV